MEEYILTDHDDTISGTTGVDVISGQGGNDLFKASNGADVSDGAAGVDTIDFTDLAVPSITVTLAGASPADITIPGQDTQSILNIENVLGTTGADTVTGDSLDNYFVGGFGDDVLAGAAGNDTIEGGIGNDTVDGGVGSDTLYGGDGTDTVSYATSGSPITGGLINGSAGTIEQGAESDTVSTFEDYQLTSQNDLLNFDTNALLVSSIDGLGGNDTIGIVTDGGNTLTSLGIDGIDLAAVFNNVEFLDFTGTDLTGGDTFTIGNDDISGILTAASGTLNIDVNQGTIALSDFTLLQQGGGSITSDTTTGSTRTVNWDDGMQLILNG